jgi:hypothetical protein
MGQKYYLKRKNIKIERKRVKETYELKKGNIEIKKEK